MSRTAVYTALILRSRPSGESNSEIFLLTAEEGIIKATVFGGPKSKLRAFASPFNSGQAWVYRDKTKEYAKLSDIDVHFWRPGLREMYDRTMAATAIAETILSSHGGGGEWGIALKLALDTLDSLNDANEDLCRHLLVHFLWRWTDFLGIQPHLESCTCGQREDIPFWYDINEGTALCANCVSDNNERKNGIIKLNPGCRRWLSATGNHEAGFLKRYSMDNKSFNEAKALVTAVLTGVLGKRLTSWEW
jgi:DNA repair protein RecO (recombination protein O)